MWAAIATAVMTREKTLTMHKQSHWNAGRDNIAGDRSSRDEAGGNITSHVTTSTHDSSLTADHVTGDITNASGDVTVDKSVSDRKSGMPAWLVATIIIAVLTAAGFSAEVLGFMNLFR